MSWLLGIFPLAFLVIFVAVSTKVVRQGEEALVERFGRYNRKLAPGLNIVIPMLDTIILEVSVREQLLDTAPFKVVTRDQKTLETTAIVFWRITDLAKAFYAVENLEFALVNLVFTTLIAHFKEVPLAEALSSNQIADALKSRMNGTSQLWGVRITSIEVTSQQITFSDAEAKSGILVFDFQKAIDWKAFEYVWDRQQKRLQMQSNQQLDLLISNVEMGDSGGSITIRMPTEVSKEKFYSDFMLDYGVRSHELAQTSYQSLQEKQYAQLQRKDSEIQNVFNIVNNIISEVGHMSNNPGGVSQSNTGSMSGGMQASVGNNNQQSMSTNIISSESVPSQAEVMELLSQLEIIIHSSALPNSEKEKTTKYLDAAKTEVEEIEPDKDLIAKNLERATKTLKAADEALGTGSNLLVKISPVVKAIVPWIGAGASTLLALL